LGLEEGLALTRALRAKLSGLAQPLYVLDLPGGFGKIPLESQNVVKTETGHRVRDLAGHWHHYPPLHPA
jgi:lysine 2,3-aminomutase